MIIIHLKSLVLLLTVNINYKAVLNPFLPHQSLKVLLVVSLEMYSRIRITFKRHLLEIKSLTLLTLSVTTFIP